jgi:hypothetical protein
MSWFTALPWLAQAWIAWAVFMALMLSVGVLRDQWLYLRDRPAWCHCIACKGHATREEHVRLGLPDDNPKNLKDSS